MARLRGGVRTQLLLQGRLAILFGLHFVHDHAPLGVDANSSHEHARVSICDLHALAVVSGAVGSHVCGCACRSMHIIWELGVP